MPIKIWNSARIEHRLEEQEKLLLAARIEALANRINPHFLFNTLTSISSLIRTQPTRRACSSLLSSLLRRLDAKHRSFRDAARGVGIDRSVLDIEVVCFGPQLRVVKDISPETLDLIVPSMLLQPIIENPQARTRARSVAAALPSAPSAEATARSSRWKTMGSG